MNTIGEHLDHADRQLRHTVDRLAAATNLTGADSAAYLLETRRTVHALHGLLTTTWGPAAESLKRVDGAQPTDERETLLALTRSLDRQGEVPAPSNERQHRDRAVNVVTAARRHVQDADAIVHTHIGTDRNHRSPDAARFADPGSRWVIAERIAAIAEATAAIEARVHQLGPASAHTPAGARRTKQLQNAAQAVLDTPHRTDARVLALHEAGHRSLTRDPLWDVAEPLERVNQQLFRRDTDGDLDGISVRTIATVGVLVTGHLEVIARATQHRAPELWDGPLGEIRELQLRRVAAEALTARQAWQQVHTEMRFLQPVGRPDVELTQQATKVRVALEAVTRRGDQWRPIEDLARGRRDVAELAHGVARVAPDVETLAAHLDAGLSRAKSADLCIRADKIGAYHVFVDERIRRQWVPAPAPLLFEVRTAARQAEAATRTMAVSAAETTVALSRLSSDPARELMARAVAAAPPQAAGDSPGRQHGPPQM